MGITLDPDNPTPPVDPNAKPQPKDEIKQNGQLKKEDKTEEV
jgi:hypothetical protein